MSGPKPHDPRSTSVSPEELTRQIDEILSRTNDSLAEEVEQLSQAHTALHNALQEG